MLGSFVLPASFTSLAQWTPAANAVKLPDSLVFVTNSSANQSSVAWNPQCSKYYSLRPGLTTYPLETWVATGGLSIFQTTTGLDMRGIWWNPNTLQLECNLFNAGGWATVPRDASCNALSAGAANIIFAGQLQPNIQSVGAYDWNTNSVLFYDVGNLYVYSRATGLLTSTIPLTGTSLATVSPYTVIYTGQTNYEVGLLDYTNKRVLLFDRTTGAFSGMSQLPASAITSGTGFRWSYANNRFWLFNSTLRKWNAYCIWNGLGCPSLMLPVEMLDMTAHCSGGSPVLTWSTGSERNSSHFLVQRSSDGFTWDIAGRVEAAGNSQQRVDYSWTDPEPLNAMDVFYRLHQVDRDGREEMFEVLPLIDCARRPGELQVFPNPASEVLHVITDLTDGSGTTRLELMDATGRILLSKRLNAAEGRASTQLDMQGLDDGTYILRVRDGSAGMLQHSAVVKQ